MPDTQTASTKKPHIVIVGAGFGGVYTARYLQKQARRGVLTITIINPTNYFLFTPLLHEVATGNLSPHSVVEPLRDIFTEESIRTITDTVTAVSYEQKVVSLSCGREIAYDYLVLATGAETATFGISGVAEHALMLRSVADARAIRARIIDQFEIHYACGMHTPITIAVIGGGPTGVELVGEIQAFVRRLYRRFYPRGDGPSVSVTLVEKGTSLLGDCDGYICRSAHSRLNSQGVQLITGAPVSAVTDTHIVFEDDSRIPASLVIWTAGVKPRTPDPNDASGIVVDQYLQKSKHVFALGDVAQEGRDGVVMPLPKLAQVAKKQARIVAHNIRAVCTGGEKRVFQYKHTGTLISIGQWYAVGSIMGIHIRGILTWWIWRTVYLFTFLSHKKRLRIAFEWTVNLFYPRDITNH